MCHESDLSHCVYAALRFQVTVAVAATGIRVVFVHVIEKKFVVRILLESFWLFVYAKRACQIKCKVYLTVWRLKNCF